MNEELYISFENYLQDEMTSVDKINFEQQLQNDADFKLQFDAYNEATNLLENKFSQEKISFEKNLNTISKNYFAEINLKKSKVIKFKPWYYAAAASVVLFIGTWFAFQNSQPLYEDFSHEEAHFLTRAGENADLKNAQDLFNNKEYAKAISAFEKLKDKNQEVNYFYAISLIEVGSYAKAENILTDLQNGNSVYKEKAHWYKALSALKQGKNESCKKILKQIPPNAEDYQKAQKLLRDLD